MRTDTRSVLVGLGRAGAATALLVLVFIGYCAVALPVSGGSNTDELGPATVFTAGNGCDRGRQQSNRTLHDPPDTRRGRALLYTRPDTVIERPHWNRNALVQLLEGVVSNGTGQAARLVPAGRWQNRHDADYRDARFIGFTSDIVGGIRVGEDDDSPMDGVVGGDLTTSEAGRWSVRRPNPALRNTAVISTISTSERRWCSTAPAGLRRTLRGGCSQLKRRHRRAAGAFGASSR